MRWRATTELDAIDVELVRSALTLLIEQLRNLALATDGSLVDPADGRALRGIRLVGGSHAHVGAVYEATTRTDRGTVRELGDGRVRMGPTTMRADDPRLTQFRQGVEDRPPARTGTIEVLADSSTELTWTTRDAIRQVVMSLAEPRRPTVFTCETEPVATGVRPRGGSRWSARIALAAPAATAGSTAAPVSGTVEHRRFVGRGDITIEPVGPRWRLHVSAQLRGRGFARPAVAVLGALAGWRLRRFLTEQLDQLGDDLAPQLQALRAHRTPETLAASWRVDLLAPFTDR